MEGLDISKIPMDLIMNIVNIIILFVIVRVLAYKPVKKFIDERRQSAENEKAEIAAASEKADQLRAEYEAKLAEIENERLAAVKKGELEGNQRAEDLVAGARRDAERIMSDARQAILVKESESAEKIRESVVELSIAIASKVIDKNMTDDDNKRLAEKFFEEMTEDKQ